MHPNFAEISWERKDQLATQEPFCNAVSKTPRLANHVKSLTFAVLDDEVDKYYCIWVTNILSVVHNLKELRILSAFMFVNHMEMFGLIPNPPFSLTRFTFSVVDQTEELNEHVVEGLHRFLENQNDITFLHLPSSQYSAHISSQLCPSLNILQGSSRNFVLDWLRSHTSSIRVLDVEVWQDGYPHFDSTVFYDELGPLAANITRIRIFDISSTFQGRMGALAPFLISVTHLHLVISKQVRLPTMD